MYATVTITIQVQALHAATLAGPGTPALAQALDGLCNSVTATSVTPDASNAIGGNSSVATAVIAAAAKEADHVQSVAEELLSQALLGDG
jgi:hypothetical protein